MQGRASSRPPWPFLKAHKGHVPLVTIDIGANNVDSCFSPTNGIDASCIANGLAAAQQDLPVILKQLRAADPHGLIVGMTYYDPSLAAWLTGTAGQAEAQASVQLANQFNAFLAHTYQVVGARVADVATAFHTNEFRTLPLVTVPLNVATICALTWMCAPAPYGPNIHANAFGYALIADTFADTIGSLPGPHAHRGEALLRR